MSKLLNIQALTVSFENKDEKVFAVNNLNFELKKGETIGIVGESGSGKSITSFAIMQLLPSIAKYITIIKKEFLLTYLSCRKKKK